MTVASWLKDTLRGLSLRRPGLVNSVTNYFTYLLFIFKWPNKVYCTVQDIFLNLGEKLFTYYSGVIIDNFVLYTFEARTIFLKLFVNEDKKKWVNTYIKFENTINICTERLKEWSCGVCM